MTKQSFVVILTSSKTFGKNPTESVDRNQTGFDVRELAYVWQLHKMGHFQLTFASPKGGECQMDPRSRKEAENDAIVRDFLNDREAQQMVQNTKRIRDLSEENAHCAILIGGHGCLMDFPESQELTSLLQRVWYKSNGMIAAIAQGTIGLINVKGGEKSSELLLKNKKITCSSDEEEKQFREELPFLVEDKLEQAGAKVETGSPYEVKVVVAEDRLITAQNSQSSKKFVEVIKEHAERIRD